MRKKHWSHLVVRAGTHKIFQVAQTTKSILVHIKRIWVSKPQATKIQFCRAVFARRVPKILDWRRKPTRSRNADKHTVGRCLLPILVQNSNLITKHMERLTNKHTVISTDIYKELLHGLIQFGPFWEITWRSRNPSRTKHQQCIIHRQRQKEPG